ncbi:MAG: beta-propeller domain-containing protein [Candidatus Methanoperedens sp.]|nr:beta-propeller domain-containing protein [Candidatus Methanoperedens sp.]
MTQKILILVSLLIISAVVFSGCIDQKKTIDTGIKDKENISGIKISEFESTQGIKKFSSAQEVREFLRANAPPASGIPMPMNAIAGNAMVGAASDMIVAPPAAIAEKAVAQTGTTDYSGTNIQVEGVDEADFVKNDGKYIYVLSQAKIVILDAYPADKAKIISTISLEGRPREIFVNDDRLIVFTENDDQIYVYPEYGYVPVQRYAQKTTVFVYDISDRKNPEQMTNYSINGNYFRSRMIGDYVYFIVKDNVNYYDNLVDMPVIRKGSAKIMAPDMYYFDNPEQSYVFHTIASIDIKSDNKIIAKSFMMGYSDNLYVSGNNIYITYRKNMPYRYYETEQEDKFYKVVVPLLPNDARDKINAIKESNLDTHEKWDKISSIMEETYNRMNEKEKQEYLRTVEKGLEEYETRIMQEQEKTVIQKIAIGKGDIEYKTKGEVPGSLLNQFSMDESGDNFRVATTLQYWTRSKSVQNNNVYVMDKDLGIIGKLEEIAPDERIYSTRFIGNRLYMVTFKRIDPLFVIDLSDPADPKILGKLKIPGFSDYLHPYDETHIIGVGKETGDNEWGGTSIKGVKISLFDVSDVENPKQLDKYEIGAAGSDSEALRDHRAFLFDKKKNLLVIPIREVTGKERYNQIYGYMPKVWQGAYVFGVTPEDGFKLKGKVSHLDDYEEPNYYWNSPYAVRRSLYMDNVLYTISAGKILMNDINNVTEINRVDLPFDKNRYNDYGWN